MADKVFSNHETITYTAYAYKGDGDYAESLLNLEWSIKEISSGT